MTSEMQKELCQQLEKQGTELTVEMNLRLALDMEWEEQMLFVECVECIGVTFPGVSREEAVEESAQPTPLRSRFRQLWERVRRLFSRRGKQAEKK